MRFSREGLGAVAVLAMLGCAASDPGVRRKDDPAVHGLRLKVAAQTQVSDPELQSTADLMRAALEQDLRSRGFALVDGNTPADGVLRLGLERLSPDTWRARLNLDLPRGGEIDGVTVKRAQPLPEGSTQIDPIVDRLVAKLEGSFNTREYAYTGVTWGGE